MTHEERSQQLLADPLFEVANHGWTHRDMRRVGGETLHDEIALAQSAYALTRQSLAARACIKDNGHTVDAVPAAMRLFRFPYGTCNARALDAVAKAGLPAIQWDVVTGDPMRGRSARAIAVDRIARRAARLDHHRPCQWSRVEYRQGAAPDRAEVESPRLSVRHR